MNLITIDIETYYDSEYSLRKLTTEQYIRDSRFEVIGLSAKIGTAPAVWYPGPEVAGFLSGYDFTDAAVLCHNTTFDGAILSWHYGVSPKLWLDTLSMSRPYHNTTVGGSLAKLSTHYGLGAKGTAVLDAKGKRREDFSPEELQRYAEYCCNDVELTYALFEKLKVGFPVGELLAIDTTLRMFTNPIIELDAELLQGHLEQLREDKNRALSTLVTPTQGIEATQKRLSSNQKLAAWLMSCGATPPTKKSPTTGRETFALGKTDSGFTDLLLHPNPKVREIVTARLATKSSLEETRTTSLLGVASRGRLPVMLNYYGAHTGRFSGGDKLNLQNLPKRGGNTMIRRAIKAPDGYSLLACDSSQIEARIIACLANQADLVQAFREGRDVYSEFASAVYEREITREDKMERFVGKTCILGLGYQMGAERLRKTLALGGGGLSVVLTEQEAARIVSIYRHKNYAISRFWERCSVALRHMVVGGGGELYRGIFYDAEGVVVPNGFRLRYPGLVSVGRGFRYISSPRDYEKLKRNPYPSEDNAEGIGWVNIYGGKMTENLVQLLAALVIREQMVEVAKHYQVLFQVHDELVVLVPEGEEAEATAVVEHIMATPRPWMPELPLACESSYGKNYGDL